MEKDLEKILIYHRTKHKNGDFSKGDWIHLLKDLKYREKQLTIPVGGKIGVVICTDCEEILGKESDC